MMKESNGLLSRAAQWAAIIACLVAVLSFMGINPFISKDTSNKDSVVLKDNSKIEKDNKVVKNTLDEQDYQDEQEHNEIIRLETIKNMSIGEFLLIPFKKHEKAPYLEVFLERHSFVGYIIAFVLYMLILNFIATAMIFVDIITNKKSIKEGIYEKKDIIIHIICFFSSLFGAYYALCLWGFW